MDFNECELSPELSSLAESSVEFVAEVPGLDCEEESLTIILTNSRQSRRRSSPSISRLRAEILCPLHCVSDKQVTHSPNQLTLADQVQAPKVARQIKQKVLLAKGNIPTPHTAYGRSLRC